MEEEFYVRVYLFRPNRVPHIKIARNSQLRITIETMDYNIPEGATASAFAKGAFSEKIYTQSCTVDGNRVSFIPQPGFFAQGRNVLQYEINNGVIPLAIDVSCEISLPDGGEATEPEQVLPYVTRAEAAADRAQEVKDSIPEDYMELSDGVNQLKDEISDTETALGPKISGTITGLNAATFCHYPIKAGRTYRIFNTAESGGLTVSTKLSDKTTSVEMITNQLLAGEYIDFTAASDAGCFRFYTNTAETGAWAFVDLGGIESRLNNAEAAIESVQKDRIAGSSIGKNLFDGRFGWTQGSWNNPSTKYLVTGPKIPVKPSTVYTVGIAAYGSTITLVNMIVRYFSAADTDLGNANYNVTRGKALTTPENTAYIRITLNTGNAQISITPDKIYSDYVHTVVMEGKINGRNYDANNACKMYAGDWTPTHVIDMAWVDDYGDYVCDRIEPIDLVFESGTINTTTGENMAGATRIRTKDYIYLEKGAYIGLLDTDGWTISVYKFSKPEPSALIGFKPMTNSPYVLDESCYVRIVEGNSNTLNDVSGKRNILILRAFSPVNKRIVRATKFRAIFAPDVSDYKFEGEVMPVPNPAGNLSNVIALWDGLLAAYPSYMTKKSIGKDASGTYDIYAYTLKGNTDVWWANKAEITGEKNLKLIWVACIHGNEPYMPYDDYCFFKDLLENRDTNPALKMLWNNVDFVIVPVANPWGYDHNSRTNSNGVNIDRNFSARWGVGRTAEGTPNYLGPSANSEAETKALISLLYQNDDAFFVVDRHGTNTFSDAGIFGYTSSRGRTDEEIGRAIAKNIDQYMKADFSWVLGDVPSNKNHTVFTWKPDDFAGGHLYEYANHNGKHGIIIESGNALYSPGNENSYPNGTIADVMRIDISVVGKVLLAYTLNNDYLLSNSQIRLIPES